MIEQLLSETGLPFKETRFLKPPKTTHLIYLDSYSRRGADSVNLIEEHDCTIELYSYVIDPDAEAKVEALLDAYSIPYDKSERYWINDEQLYQVVYDFSYIKKRRTVNG